MIDEIGNYWIEIISIRRIKDHEIRIQLRLKFLEKIKSIHILFALRMTTSLLSTRVSKKTTTNRL